MFKQKKIQTSVAGSNIFFSSKHSLGWPTESRAVVDMIGGRIGVGYAAWPLTGKVTACGFGADPLRRGTPREPVMLAITITLNILYIKLERTIYK